MSQENVGRQVLSIPINSTAKSSTDTLVPIARWRMNAFICSSLFSAPPPAPGRPAPTSTRPAPPARPGDRRQAVKDHRFGSELCQLAVTLGGHKRLVGAVNVAEESGLGHPNLAVLSGATEILLDVGHRVLRVHENVQPHPDRVRQPLVKGRLVAAMVEVGDGTIAGPMIRVSGAAVRLP